MMAKKPHHNNVSSIMRKTVFWFLTSTDTNQAVQPQKMARGLKLQILILEALYYLFIAKTKALISCALTTQLICAFVFAYTTRGPMVL